MYRPLQTFLIIFLFCFWSLVLKSGLTSVERPYYMAVVLLGKFRLFSQWQSIKTGLKIQIERHTIWQKKKWKTRSWLPQSSAAVPVFFFGHSRIVCPSVYGCYNIGRHSRKIQSCPNVKLWKTLNNTSVYIIVIVNWRLF